MKTSFLRLISMLAIVAMTACASDDDSIDDSSSSSSDNNSATTATAEDVLNKVTTNGDITTFNVDINKTSLSETLAVDENGRSAVTEWRVIGQGKDCTLLDVHILTGRTHQIRVHMRYIHHPVCGDVIYGYASGVKVSRLMLHAYSLDFTHPVTGESMHMVCPLPPAFEDNLRKCHVETWPV